MVLVTVALIIVSGFSFVLYLFLSHIKNLEVLLKAKDLIEAKHFESKPVLPKIPKDEQEILSEVFDNKSPQEIRESFRNQ